MQIAALVLGIIGGLAGIGGAVFALFVGGIGSAFGAEGSGTVVGLGLMAIVSSILGIVGGALAMSRPKAAGILMLVSAVAGAVFISFGYVVAFPCLLVGGILALVASRQKDAAGTG
ncbi:MAG: DUF4064 domain-containing protein [Alicyclobacillaceae bacterium]|nr:DUF4064 domain-containing protein [Alicyclobacillaceae bacterium]